MFIAPLSYGIFITCVFLMGIVILVAKLLGHVPNSIGNCAKYVSKSDIVKGAIGAREKFMERQKPINCYNEVYEGKTFVTNKWDMDKVSERVGVRVRFSREPPGGGRPPPPPAPRPPRRPPPAPPRPPAPPPPLQNQPQTPTPINRRTTRSSLKMPRATSSQISSKRTPTTCATRP